jgi:hypothetical protein
VFPSLPPIRDDEEWVVLRTGEAMREAAGRFRNCLREKVHVTALGRAAFVKWRREPGAVVELAALSTGSGAPAWLLEGVYGERNSRVDQQTASTVCRKLQRAGVLLPAKLGHAQRHNKAAPLLDVYDFDGIAHLEAAIEEEVEGIIEQVAREAAA